MAGPETFRVLIEYLELDYTTAMHEGWLDLTNAIVAHEERVVRDAVSARST